MTPPDGAAPDAYAKTDRNRIRRNNVRAHYDREAVHGVLDAGLMCHVAYVFDGQPYVTSTAYWRSGAYVYWHGSSASRMIRRVGGGIPVCFSVALLDGVVLARSGFHHSFNYRSVVAYGTAEEIEDTDEKLRALEAFTERLVPGRWAELRAPTDQEMKATAVMRMELREVAAKIRRGPPNDDAEDMDAPVWAGVLPTHRAFGKPEPDPAMRQGISEPDYLKHIRFD